MKVYTMKKTEKLIVDITFDLLYKNGYYATGLTEILDQANMTKGAMYYHFKSKHALVLSTITHYLEPWLNDQWTEPFENSDEPIQSIINQISIYKDNFADKENYLSIKHGCPLSNFILDLSDKDEEFFEYLSNVYARWQNSFEKALTKAQSLKQTKTDFDAKKQALFIISSLEGSIVSAKAHNDLNILSESIEVLENYIKNI